MTALATRDAVGEVCTTIASADFRQKVAQALPPGVTLDRFERTTLTAIQQNPEVVTADRQSLYNSVIRCAQDGLLPDGREAALVVFKVKGEQKVQYLPMIFGLRKKAAEHGFSLTAYTIHANDEFEYELGLDPTIHHKPAKLGEDRGEIVGAYSVATDKRTGEKYLEVMSRAEIEQVRAVSRAATSEYGPWVKWYGEQCRKTVARRNYKQIPLGALDESAARVLDAIDSEYDLGDKRMTREEANVAAPLSNLKAPSDSGPDDQIEDGVLDYSGYVIEGTVHNEKTLAQVLAEDDGQAWLKTKLKSLAADHPLRAPIEGFVAAELPEVFAAYTEWRQGQ